MAKSSKPPDLAELAKLFGMNKEQLETPEYSQAQAAKQERENEEDWVNLEAESVIFYMETKNREAIFKKKTCKWCDRNFLSSYTAVAYCSKECRKEYFASKMIPWNYEGRTEAERWGGTIPRIIGPTATEMLQGMTFPEVEEEPTPEKPSPVDDDDDIAALLAKADKAIRGE